jgi:ribosomal protein S18 acetylase RimI-like enzyme
MKKYIQSILQNYIYEYDETFIDQNLEDYLVKIESNAITQMYFERGNLIGFVFYYANDDEGNAFLSLIFVEPTSQGRQIGKCLLSNSIIDLRTRSFKNYRLEVKKINVKALRLYQNFGFKVERDLGEKLIMKLELL